MTVWTRDSATLYTGSCMDVLPTLPERSVHVCMTSPPYFALRSYLPKGHPDKGKEIGSEVSPEAFIATMVAVFAEVRRVLRDDGVLWLNLGDSYGANYRGGGPRTASAKQLSNQGSEAFMGRNGESDGQLQNIPHRVAEALRQDGWIWRQTIVWAKRSPMPESVGGTKWVRCRVKVGAAAREFKGHDREQGARDDVDGKSFASQADWSDCPGCPKCEPNGGYVLRRGSGRCTTAHEYIFLFAKTGKYFWDGEASKEPATVAPHRSGYVNGSDYAVGPMSRGGHSQREQPDRVWSEAGGRNPRSVWKMSSEDMFRLRDDITPEQRAFVMRRISGEDYR